MEGAMRMVLGVMLVLIFSGAAGAQSAVDPGDPAGLHMGTDLSPQDTRFAHATPLVSDSSGNLSSGDARVKGGALTKRVDPFYPQIARTAHVTGSVVLHCLIAEDGRVEDIEYISGPPLLMKSAMDAVRQWEYEPTMLNGTPVKVDTKVTVVYALDDRSGAEDVHLKGKVVPASLVYQVTPVYPKEAKKKHIEGTVVLRAMIQKDGTVRDVRLISGPPELTDAAMTAVAQWRYTPTMLENEPVEVDTTISVVFKL